MLSTISLDNVDYNRNDEYVDKYVDCTTNTIKNKINQYINTLIKLTFTN